MTNMKRIFIYTSLVLVAALALSCKNNAKEDDFANEELAEAAKLFLTEDIMKTLDEMAQICINESNVFDVSDIISSGLTEEEKLIQPDYLLNAEQTKDLVTKTQKVNALAILTTERYIRKAYDMPIVETDKAISRLMLDLNHPISADENKELSPSEKVKRIYEQCKQHGDLVYFWQFNFASINELNYIIAQNPDIFFRNITDEQYASLLTRFKTTVNAVRTLAQYDPEVEKAVILFDQNRKYQDINEVLARTQTKEDAKQFYIDTKYERIAHRDAMLK